MDQIGRRKFLETLARDGLVLLGATHLLRSSRALAQTSDDKKPNFILILIDDLGWKDVGCYGSSFYETPNIDKLASQGMKFTNAYAACPVCSPTRVSIMTGKYPARVHLTDWISGHKRPWAKLSIPDWTQYMALEEVTVAEALKPAGYVSAHIGKWHLGGDAYSPEKQGFDLNFGGYARGAPPSYFYPYNIPNITTGEPGEYLTDRLTDEAEGFIEKNKDKPFFIYLSHYAVHTPLQAKPDLIEKYKAKVRPDEPQNNPIYAAMVESMDESVGRIMRKLAELKIADRTVVMFMSDNGGQARVTSNAPLRAGKGTMYEGGIREPMIVCWPGVVKPGSVCDVPVTSVDFYPTILDIAGVKGDPKHVVDGVSIVPLLKQTAAFPARAIYWHYPHYHPGGAGPSGAVRKGDYKLIESYEDGHVELYNLKDDISEQKDLARLKPEKANELRRMLANWRREVGAQMPTPNPQYDPAKDRVPPKKPKKKKRK